MVVDAIAQPSARHEQSTGKVIGLRLFVKANVGRVERERASPDSPRLCRLTPAGSRSISYPDSMIGNSPFSRAPWDKVTFDCTFG